MPFSIVLESLVDCLLRVKFAASMLGKWTKRRPDVDTV